MNDHHKTSRPPAPRDDAQPAATPDPDPAVSEPAASDRSAERKRREAAALRANLARRKTAQRARRDPGGEPDAT